MHPGLGDLVGISDLWRENRWIRTKSRISIAYLINCCFSAPLELGPYELSLQRHEPKENVVNKQPGQKEFN